MCTESINGHVLLSMLRSGAGRLETSRADVNDLNVFPIPDGDTGDNMYMTLASGCQSASAVSRQGIGEVAAAASKGMLLGARGNSGVILSRIFAGLANGLEGLSEATPPQFHAAMRNAVKEAYSAVSHPVEGTILTVIREAVEAAPSDAASMEDYFGALLPAMEASLDNTPELLAVLKDAGVVDSGGAGLVCIFRGMASPDAGHAGDAPAAAGASSGPDLDAFGPDSELEFGYCTEFLLRLQNSKVEDAENFDETPIRRYLEGAGESVACFREGSVVKAHVHTDDPGAILSHCRRWGEYLTVKVENMTLMHNGTVAPRDNFKRRRKPFGVVTVASGAGLVQSLREAGADFVIDGGQTMNPSTADFLAAFARVQADTVFVFPNNSNIILTARQAAEMAGDTRVVVIPTRDFGAGYVAIASMDFSSNDVDAIEAAAVENASSVRTAMVSRSTRTAEIDGVDVHEGDFIGFCDSVIMTDSPDRSSAGRSLLEKAGAADCDVCLVFHGADVPSDEAEALAGELSDLHPMAEFKLVRGDQPVFDYIFVLC